jgi:hypothetical protein
VKLNIISHSQRRSLEHPSRYEAQHHFSFPDMKLITSLQIRSSKSFFILRYEAYNISPDVKLNIISHSQRRSL